MNKHEFNEAMNCFIQQNQSVERATIRLKELAQMIPGIKTRLAQFKEALRNVDRAGYSERDLWYESPYHVQFPEAVRGAMKNGLNMSIHNHGTILKKYMKEAEELHNNVMQYAKTCECAVAIRQEHGSVALTKQYIHPWMESQKILIKRS